MRPEPHTFQSFLVGADHPGLKARPIELQPVADAFVHAHNIPRVEAFAVGRVHHHHPRFCGRPQVEKVGLTHLHHAVHVRFFQAVSGLTDGARVVVGGPNQGLHRLNAVHGLVTDLTPNPSVKIAPLHERELPTPCLHRQSGRPKRRLGGKRARAAHRIDERGAWAPTAQREQPRSEHLIEGRLRFGGTVPTMGQRRASGVHAQGHFVSCDVQVEPHVGAHPVDAWSLACFAPEPVHHRVLQTQGSKVVVREHLRVHRRVHDECAVHRNQVFPREACALAVEVVRVLGIELCEVPQNAQHEPAVQAEVVHRLEVRLTRHPPPSDHHFHGAGLAHVLGHQVFEAGQGFGMKFHPPFRFVL